MSIYTAARIHKDSGQVIAHQYDESQAAFVGKQLPSDVTFLSLGDSPDYAWKVPAHADVLLISQDSAKIGLHKDMPAPVGWPFNLQWVHLRSTGLDKYPNWIFAVPQVTVSRGCYAKPIAEYVLTAMLTVVKNIPDIWAKSPADWHQHKLSGLSGRTLGIIGFGQIGQAIAHRALAFDMTVIGTKRSNGSSGIKTVKIVPFEQLLRVSDYIVVCTPLTVETRGMLDGSAFSRMKKGTHLINVGRGAVINTDALRSALDETLGGATLDVTEPEPPPIGHWLYDHPKVRLSPHISGSSPETSARLTAFFVENLQRYRNGKELHGLVDSVLRY